MPNARLNARLKDSGLSNPAQNAASSTEQGSPVTKPEVHVESDA